MSKNDKSSGFNPLMSVIIVLVLLIVIAVFATISVMIYSVSQKTAVTSNTTASPVEENISDSESLLENDVETELSVTDNNMPTSSPSGFTDEEYIVAVKTAIVLGITVSMNYSQRASIKA